MWSACERKSLLLVTLCVVALSAATRTLAADLAQQTVYTKAPALSVAIRDQLAQNVAQPLTTFGEQHRPGLRIPSSSDQGGELAARSAPHELPARESVHRRILGNLVRTVSGGAVR